ncbi:hypothetical protein AVEN_47723-1 [Araneus ventricosus]|uniref:Uncharacterized protein n=1 Tax=Araneus ventricosus TaxID=182803 RepID=A0A4Y2T160_ARAVE|nr:hypothetical protein AVEN_47723-1 [Araneus ventricosus]
MDEYNNFHHRALGTYANAITQVERHWYILLFHIVTMVVEAFVPSVNQSMETGIEEIRVQVAEPLNEGVLHFHIDSKMATCQVLLQRSEEMKITGCEIRTVARVFQCLCGGRARQCRVSRPIFVTLHSLRKLPLVDDEFKLGMFSLNANTLLHFSLQSPTMYPSTAASSNRDFRASRHN